MTNPHDDSFYGQPVATQSYEQRIKVLTAAVEDLSEKLADQKEMFEACFKDRLHYTAKCEKYAMQIAALEAEVAHWKANTKDMADRNSVLRHRYDLPVDRLPAMRRMEELQEKLTEQTLKADQARAINNIIDGSIKELEADSERYKHLISNNRRYRIQLPYVGLQTKNQYDQAIDQEIALDKANNPSHT